VRHSTAIVSTVRNESATVGNSTTTPIILVVKWDARIADLSARCIRKEKDELYPWKSKFYWLVLCERERRTKSSEPGNVDHSISQSYSKSYLTSLS
jgi:hypothetical protein